MHAQFEGPGMELTAVILRLHFVIFTAIEAFNAKGVGAGMHVPYTDTDVANWYSPAHADANTDLIERLEDVNALLAHARARMPSSTIKDKETLDHNKKMTIQTANATLVNNIITASIGQEGCKTLENIPTFQAHQEVYDVMTKAHTNLYHKHSFQAIFSVFADMFARKLTGSTAKHTSLNTPPQVEKETIDEFKKTIKDAADILINKKLQNVDMLVDHLTALALVQYINLAAENKNLRSDYKSIFKIARADIAADVAKDARPFDSARLEIHKQALDTALLAAGLHEIPPPLSAGHLRAMTAIPTTRPPRRLPKSAAATAGAAAGGKIISRPCFHCNKIGHTQPNCLVPTTPASTKLAFKRKADYIQATRCEEGRV